MFYELRFGRAAASAGRESSMSVRKIAECWIGVAPAALLASCGFDPGQAADGGGRAALPVHVETVLDDKLTILSFDGTEHSSSQSDADVEEEVTSF